MSEKQPSSMEAAGQLEAGLSPTSPVSTQSFGPEKGPATRSNTILSRGQTSISAFGTRTASWVTSVGTALAPNTSDAKGDMIVPTLEEFPNGYPRVSYFLNSDETFSMYRRFGQLHSRVLLYKQDQIRRLEEELLRLDKVDEELSQTQKFLQSQLKDERRKSPPTGCARTRGAVIADIEQKLLEYGQMLAQAERLQAMNKPSDRDHKSVSNFFFNEAPLMEKDERFLKHKEDLVSIRSGREHAWLDGAVDTLLRWYPRPAKWVFADKATQAKTNNGRIHYFTRSRIHLFVTFIITLLILALLVVPIWLLFYLTVDLENNINSTVCIGVLLIATLIFSCVLSLFTKAKRHEVLAAAAGYCAVLVVFVGNIGDVKGSGGPTPS